MTKLKFKNHLRKYNANRSALKSVHMTTGIASWPYQYWCSKTKVEVSYLSQATIELGKCLDVAEKAPSLCMEAQKVVAQLPSSDMGSLSYSQSEKNLMCNLANTMSHVLSE